MCGMAGFLPRGSDSSFKDSRNFKESLKEMLKYLEIRGTHATGLISISDNGSFYTDKSPEKSSNYIDNINNDFDSIIESSKALIYHVRLATVGDPEDNINNHPFASADNRLHLVHNGTLAHTYNGFKEQDRLKEMQESECDSELLLRYIEHLRKKKNISVQKAFESMFSTFMGAMAVILYDFYDNKIFFVRNKKRPLFFIFYKSFILYASTQEILEVFVNSYSESMEKDNFFRVNKHKVLTYDLEKFSFKMSKPLFHKYVVENPFTRNISSYCNNQTTPNFMSYSFSNDIIPEKVSSTKETHVVGMSYSVVERLKYIKRTRKTFYNFIESSLRDVHFVEYLEAALPCSIREFILNYNLLFILIAYDFIFHQKSFDWDKSKIEQECSLYYLILNMYYGMDLSYVTSTTDIPVSKLGDLNKLILADESFKAHLISIGVPILYTNMLLITKAYVDEMVGFKWPSGLYKRLLKCWEGIDYLSLKDSYNNLEFKG